ncbi:hypothetical protein [Paraferrimonas sp. SM1919]|uniref:hypothetical protein n=1 Tax=Paraferrimonas sp. SM1919 TaxID=2662263 RepID=UPI0013D2CFAE|nr:hypothetical protein [Paraferrimonas sp. SM1919]
MTTKNIWAEFANIELSDYEQKQIDQIKQQQQAENAQVQTQGDSSVLQKAKTTLQVKQYLTTLNLSDARLQLLANAATELLTENKERAKKRELVQTFKTKVFNFAKEHNMSYEQVIDIMYSLEQQ